MSYNGVGRACQTGVQHFATLLRSFPEEGKAECGKGSLIQNVKDRAKTCSAVLLAAVFLGPVGVAQVSRHSALAQVTGKAEPASQVAKIPLCTGATTNPPSPALAQAGPSPHSVVLSWKASIPRSDAPKDAIKGYYVYRSLRSNGFSESDRLNALPLKETRCIDTAVKPRKKYFYVVKALSEGGAPSDFSTQITVEIPSH